MKKIFALLLSLAAASLIAACDYQNTSYEKGESTVLSLQDIISDKPKNTAYRKTILQSYPSGEESRWDIFYDVHNNEIRNVCTSDILNHPQPDYAASKDSPFLTDTTYVYNENGTIAEKRTVFLGEVRVNKYVYNDNKNVISETMSENGIEGTSLSYEYDEYNNPVKVHHILNGNIVYTDEYQYTYDENGRITYKIWKNRFNEEIIFKTWFEYDEHGNLTLEKEFREGADVPTYEKYYYDENNRLIRNESYIDDKLLSENIFEYEFYTSPPIDVNS